MTTEPTASPPWLVTVLTLDALCGATVSGFGTPLIPEVARTHGISLEAATWVLTVTLVVGAVTIPVVSRLGDSGRRRLVLVATLGGIVCGSVLAAAWHTLPGLLAGRACQGLGYALVPLTISLARQHLAGERLRRTLALISVSLAAGAGLANPLIGLFVRYLDYRAGFAFGALVTAVAVVCTLRVLPKARAQAQPLGVDVAGAVLLGLGLACGLLAVSRGVSWGWTSAPVLLLGATAAVLLGWWLRVEWQHDRPLVDLRLASSPALLGVNLTAFCTGVAVFGGMSLVYRVIQAPAAHHGLGQSLLVAGLLLLPMSVGSLLAPPLARAAAHRFGVRLVLPLGSVTVAASYAVFALAHHRGWQILVVTFLAGVGIGIAYSIMPAIIVARTPAERTSSATGLNTVLRITGGAIGAAVIASVQAARTPAGTAFPLEAGYVAAALVSVALCAVAALVSVLFVRNAAADEDLRVEDPDVSLLMREAVTDATGAPPAYGGSGPAAGSDGKLGRRERPGR
ncbi:MAG TPA: MFS transporter [Pseudonocardiaceae bacterium]